MENYSKYLYDNIECWCYWAEKIKEQIKISVQTYLSEYINSETFVVKIGWDEEIIIPEKMMVFIYIHIKESIPNDVIDSFMKANGINKYYISKERFYDVVLMYNIKEYNDYNAISPDEEQQVVATEDDKENISPEKEYESQNMEKNQDNDFIQIIPTPLPKQLPCIHRESVWEPEPEENIMEIVKYSPFGYNDKEYKNNTLKDVDITTITPSKWDCPVENIKVIKKQKYPNYYDDDIYYIQATIGQDRTCYYSKINDTDIQMFLQRDETGRFIRDITPEMLVEKYLGVPIMMSSIKEIGKCIKEYGDWARIPAGNRPVFMPDMDTTVNGIYTDKPLVNKVCILLKKELTYLYAEIGGISRLALLDKDIIKMLLTSDRSCFSGRMSLARAVVVIFGHELPFIAKNMEIDEESSLVQHHYPFNNDTRQVIIKDNCEKIDEKDIKMPKGYKIATGIINKYRWMVSKEYDTYYINYHITGGIYRRFEEIKKPLTEQQLYNFFERDENGKYTRRITPEHLAIMAATEKILKEKIMMDMYYDGYPFDIIEEKIGWNKENIETFLKKYKLQRRRHLYITDIPEKTRKAIREGYAKGLSIPQLAKKYDIKSEAKIYLMIKTILKKERSKSND